MSESVLASFRQMVETVAGASELEVTSPAGTVDEALIAAAAGTPGVKAAAGLVEGFLSLADRTDEALYLLGLDFLGSPVWGEQLPREAIEIPDEIAFLAQPDSVMLTHRFAAPAALAQDGAVRVTVPGGTRTLRVRGLLRDAPVARLFDGMIAIMDLPAAQRLLGREGGVDRIAIELAPGVRAEDVRARLAASLGAGVEVAPPESRGSQCEKLLFSLRSMLVVASWLAIIVGVFIVYQTVAVSVQQRRREFALLSTVGVRRGTLIRLCLGETLVLAASGALAGVGGGWLLGAAATGLVGHTASEIWLPLDVSRRAHSVEATLSGALVGVGTALVAAYLAVRATFRTPTVEALRPVGAEVEETHSLVRPTIVALVLVAATWLVALAPQGLGFAGIVTLIVATQAIAYTGSAILGAPLVSVVGGLWRRLGRRARSLPVRLASANLPRTPARSGTTVATIAATLGLAITLVGLVQSFETAWTGWIEHHFGADLFVGSGGRFRLLAGPPMDAEVAKRIASTPGVASVEPFRVVQIRMEDRPVFLESLSLTERLAHGGLAMVEGDLAAAKADLEAGESVLLSDNLATRVGLHRGDRVILPTPGGPRGFRVDGTFVDYLGSLDLGAVAVAQTQLAAIWGDHFANLYRVWLEPGVSPSVARRAVLERLGADGYYVLTARQFVDGVRSVLDRFFVATWALELVALVVGVIGVVNAQLATILDRSGEIAMARTIGVPARHIRRTVLIECAALGLLGAACGVALGAMLGAQFIWVSLRLITGWRIPLKLPLAPMLWSLLLAAAVSAAAGYLPARAAARLETRQRSVD